MRIKTVAALTAFLFLGVFASASAGGTLRSQESDGTVRVYNNVSIKVVHRTLRITSHDGKGTLVINQATCSYEGALQRCNPLKVTLEQGGATKTIGLKNGTIYVNPTNENQQLPLSSQQLPGHGILLSFNTQRGTYVSMSGTIDGLVR
jgi:hypothetical protein